MGMFEGIFGKREGEKTGRENAGGDFMAVPPQAPGGTTEEEAEMMETKRLKIEELQAKIAGIEGDSTHPEYENLDLYREQLKALQDTVQ